MAKKRGAKKAAVKKKKATRRVRKTAKKRVYKKKEQAAKNIGIMDKKLINAEPVFGQKHPQCREVSHFYSLPGQLNLVLHGVPFHLITDQFVRFHAVQSTIIGWKFTILYTVILFSTIANTILFKNQYIDWVIWTFLIVAIAHALINLYLAYNTRKCKEVSIPFVTDFAKKVAG